MNTNILEWILQTWEVTEGTRPDSQHWLNWTRRHECQCDSEPRTHRGQFALHLTLTLCYTFSDVHVFLLGPAAPVSGVRLRPVLCCNTLLHLVLFRVTSNFMTCLVRSGSRCTSWRSPWLLTDSLWGASDSFWVLPLDHWTCLWRRCLVTRWRRWWLHSGIHKCHKPPFSNSERSLFRDKRDNFMRSIIVFAVFPAICTVFFDIFPSMEPFICFWTSQNVLIAAAFNWTSWHLCTN